MNETTPPDERHPLLWKIGAAAMFLMIADSAAADAIDGNWCSADGRTFSIHGSEIVTPRGSRTEGQYSRHYFSYVVPASEPGAGGTINMTLLNENAVRIEPDAANSRPMEIWNRCGPSVSGVRRPAIAS